MGQNFSIFFVFFLFFLSIFTITSVGCKSLDFLIQGTEGRDVNQIALFGSEEVDFGELDKVELKGFKISDFNHSKVKEYVKIYQGNYKKHLIAILERGSKYIPTIKKIFREKGVPEEFCYLPIIESGFRPHAKSYMSAVGIWQFIYTTGKYYGLENSYWHDDRSDPLKSTIAAAYHLKFLYRQFNDWLLVLAAYNAGSGKISRAIKMYGTRDFWEMCRRGNYIRKETRNYVPKFIAATLVAKNPNQYGLPEPPVGNEKLITFKVKDATGVNLLAECAGMEIGDFKNLNPALKRWATPPATTFDINLPEDKVNRFVEHFSKIDDSKRVTYRRYFVRMGDSLTSIGRKFKVPLPPIAQLNKMKSLNEIRAGESIFIPIEGLKNAHRADNQSRANRIKKSTSKKYNYIFFHEVGETDNLYNIAQKYGIDDMIDIYRWNNLKNYHSIRPGSLLMIKEVRKDKDAVTQHSASDNF